MANEGSTKPTYSELEAELLRVRGLLQRMGLRLRELTSETDAALAGAESVEMGKVNRVDEQ